MTILQEITLPDIGNFTAVEIIEVPVKVGDLIGKETTLLVLETDKATLDIPAPVAGVIKALKHKVGDKVSKGDVIALIEVDGAEHDTVVKVSAVKAVGALSSQEHMVHSVAIKNAIKSSYNDAYSGPATRKLARELGIDLASVKGTGRKDRITTSDLMAYVKNKLQSTGQMYAPIEYDFSQFGETEVKPLSRIKLKTAENLHRNWVTIPHVTQFDEADFTEVEAFRVNYNQALGTAHNAQKVKLTPLVLLMRAIVETLDKYPQFMSSLSADGKNLIYKKYYHLGVAVDTENGLVVPVIRDVNKKSMEQLALELKEKSELARSGKLAGGDMQGSCFTISSLGGIGGVNFTPIINAPNVAILGVSRAKIQAVYRETGFIPRLMLPLALSYDHRVIDGAEAARFLQYLAEVIAIVHKGLN